MKRFGSSESNDFSPFRWHCITGDITELRDKFLKYLSSTFEYDGIKLVEGYLTYHIGVHDEDKDYAGTRDERNNGCAIISDLAVENLMAAILK